MSAANGPLCAKPGKYKSRTNSDLQVVLRNRQNISLRILEPRNPVAVRSLPDSELILSDAVVMLEDHAPGCQITDFILDATHVPTENRKPSRLEVLVT